MTRDPDYDIALSFAGEDRDYVERVARRLADRGIKVFYDRLEEATLWGKDLYVHLSEVYQHQARFTVMFVSAAYAEKRWTNHERRAAQARAFDDAQEYILPARFDDTEIPGVLPTVGYVDLRGRSPEELAALVERKLVDAGGSVPTELVRRDLSRTSTTASANPQELVVRVRDDEGAPIADCGIVVQADNGTTLPGRTNAEGRATIEVRTRRSFRLLVAHPRFPATFRDRVDVEVDVDVVLQQTENVGSLIVNGTGYIPGLAGRLSPILDTSGRTYLYADNIAINGGGQQPATFAIGRPIELEDAHGIIVHAIVKHIAGDVSLIQFTRRS